MLRGETVVKVESAERHHAMVNFWRTSVSCILGTLFWLWTGWTSGSGAMVMIAVVTALAMRLPNPRMVAIDFLYGTGGVTVGHLVLPGDHAGDAAEHAVAASARRRWRSLSDRSAEKASRIAGALASTINILVLDNPMQFQFSQFLDSALGQIVGCFLALMVILIVRITPGPEPVGCC